MPKAERGTPKDIANKMKAKGLQKLKFYCQMCNKQCRDENGFKCHLTSDSHLRQMKIFAENAGEFLDSFSAEFEQSYMDTLRRRHGTKKMNANNVYQEVIQDKHHVHMNSTKWATLTDFVQYLGKTGKCVVEETERGWYVTYIERDPALLARQEAHRRRVESERAEEEKAAKRMEKQRVEAAKAVALAGGTVEVAEASKMERSEDDKPVALTIGSGGGSGAANGTAGSGTGGGSLDGLAGKKRKKSSSSSGDAKKVKAVFGGDDEDEDEDDDPDQDRKPAAKPTPSNGDAKPAKLVEAAAAAQAGTPATAALESSASSSKSDGRHKGSRSGPLVSSTSKQKPEVDLLIATATAACIYDADARRKCRDEDYYRRKAFKMAGGDGGDGLGSGGKSSSSSKRIDDIRKDYWIRRNIVVRIISKKLSGGKYYKRKGVIIRVIDRYMAEVEILDTAPDAKDGGDLIRIDQDDLETVVPKEGKECRILNGRGRGKRAEVVSLDKAKYRGTLKILDSGEVVEKIHYEDFSRIA